MRHTGLEDRVISEREYRLLKRTQRMANRLIIEIIKKHEIETLDEFYCPFTKSLARSLGYSKACEDLQKAINTDLNRRSDNKLA